MPLPTLYLPEMMLSEVHRQTKAQAGVGLLVDAHGMVIGLATEDTVPAGTQVVRLPGRALLPGLANAHSHTFQRLFRGRAEGRAAGGDTFWTWREQMYRAAGFVSPEDLYDVARATFLEMVAAGITVVGEFHYLHRDPSGEAYDDPNLMGKQVIAAARSVGIRICLLRSGYFRAGFERAPHPGQRRFYELPEEYLRNLQDLIAEFGQAKTVTVGAAPHSIRAVPLNELKAIAEFSSSRGQLPLHMHISEQVGENAACVAEYGMTPVTLMAEHEILSPQTTLIRRQNAIWETGYFQQTRRRGWAFQWLSVRIARRRSTFWRTRGSLNTICGCATSSAGFSMLQRVRTGLIGSRSGQAY